MGPPEGISLFGSRTISEPRSAFNYRALLVNAIIGLCRCPVYLLVLARVLFHSLLEFLRSNRGRRNSNDRSGKSEGRNFGKIFPNNSRDPSIHIPSRYEESEKKQRSEIRGKTMYCEKRKERDGERDGETCSNGSGPDGD